jgi:hypothetical protein
MAYPDLARRPEINYKKTEFSQDTKWSGQGFNYNIWHSMRSNWEKKMFDIGSPEGISAEHAQERGMAFGWSKIFESASYGKLSKLKMNQPGIEAWGQGMHALQDGMAHAGVSMSEHSVVNDMYGSINTAQELTNSAITVHSVMSGDMDTFNKMHKGGVAKLNLKGISQDNLRELYHAAEKQGKKLSYNWDTNTYDIE